MNMLRKNNNNFNYLFFILVVAFANWACAQQFTVETARVIEADGWKQVPEILSRIQPPQFPDQDFIVTDFGAVNDSTIDSRSAIMAAVAACSKAGGGRVVIPKGNYLSNGPIHLENSINLYLEEGALLLFGVDPDFYTPLVLVRWEGTMCYNFSPLIYARNKTNIAVTGEGLLDGQTEGTWSEWKKRNNGKNQKLEKPVLRQAGNDLTPVETRVFGNGFLDLDGNGKDDGHGDGKRHYLRPTFIEFIECSNVLIEGVTLKSSPFWNVHPVFCKNVTIRNVKVRKGTTNDDGLDPDSCTDVLIENCDIDTNDDAIAIKAGRDQDAWNRPSGENIIIRNNNLTSGVNAVCVGSEMSGGVRNVFIENNFVGSSKHGINFKCNLDRGGQVEKIYIRKMKMKECREAMFIFRMDYHGYRGNNFPTKFNDFYVSDINCKKVDSVAIIIVGVENSLINRVSLQNITIKDARKPSVIRFAENIIAHNVVINSKPWQPF